MPITLNFVLAVVSFIVAAACIVPMQGLKGGNGSILFSRILFVVATLATAVFIFLYLVSLFAI